MLSRIVIEAEENGNSQTMLRVSIDKHLAAENLTAPEAQLLVGEILDRIPVAEVTLDAQEREQDRRLAAIDLDIAAGRYRVALTSRDDDDADDAPAPAVNTRRDARDRRKNPEVVKFMGHDRAQRSAPLARDSIDPLIATDPECPRWRLWISRDRPLAGPGAGQAWPRRFGRWTLRVL